MRCEFCGRELPRRMTFAGFEVPVPCECEGAVAERARLDEEERRRGYDACLRKAVANAGIPPRFRLYETFGDGGGAYIYGPQGRGKTERACGILRGYLKGGIRDVGGGTYVSTRSARFVAVPELLMRMRRTYDRRDETESDLMWAYAGVGMLCLDDLGKGQMTDWAIERIYTLVNMRYENARPIVVTSQYSGEELVARLSERGDEQTAMAIWSRITEMCKVGRVTGRDRRLG